MKMSLCLQSIAMVVTTVLIVSGLNYSKAQAASSVPSSRLERLTRGVNLQGWFWGDFDAYGFGEYDLRLIRSLGFRHIRVPVHIDVLFDEETPEEPKSENLGMLKGALQLAISCDLGVIVELHSVDERGWSNEAYIAKLERFWQRLAASLIEFDPEMLFLEVMNEPRAATPKAWDKTQKRYIAAMRRGAPHHTLIASGNCFSSTGQWESVRAFSQMAPVDDANVVYNFHFYDPSTFTQQGATFGWEHLPYFHDLPYPTVSLSKEEKDALAADIDPVARADAKAYLNGKWNKAKVAKTIAPALAWAKKHDVPVTANEFGVYKGKVSPESRCNWLKDVREVLEEGGIGWALWEYNLGFGFIEWGEVDQAVIAALGLSTTKD